MVKLIVVYQQLDLTLPRSSVSHGRNHHRTLGPNTVLQPPLERAPKESTRMSNDFAIKQGHKANNDG